LLFNRNSVVVSYIYPLQSLFVLVYLLEMAK
jgi:hypothetical protein